MGKMVVPMEAARTAAEAERGMVVLVLEAAIAAWS